MIKKISFKLIAGGMILTGLLIHAGSAYSASSSATLRVSCTILPILQVSSQALSTSQSNQEYLTTQSVKETNQGLLRYYTVTAL